MQVYGELILEHAGLPRKCDSKPWRTLSGLQLWSPHRRHDMTRTRLAMQVAPAAELEGVDEGVEARLEQLRGGAGCDVALRRCSAWEGGGRLCRKTVRVRVGVMQDERFLALCARAQPASQSSTRVLQGTMCSPDGTRVQDCKWHAVAGGEVPAFFRTPWLPRGCASRSDAPTPHPAASFVDACSLTSYRKLLTIPTTGIKRVWEY